MNAIIEIGSNSLKLLIYKTEPTFEVVLDKTTITRLSEGYNETGEISVLALHRNIDEIHKCLHLARKHNCEKIAIYGTMIFRSARNNEEVLRYIREQTGLELKVLSGQQEAKYSYLAATYSLPIKNGKVLVVDSGGGSTEFIFGRNGEVSYAQSIDVGAVTLSDKFKLQNEVGPEIIDKCESYLKDKFKRIEPEQIPDTIIGIGGTVTTISAMLQKLEVYSAEKVHGSSIELKDIVKLEKEISLKNLEMRKSIIGLSPKRADIILGGLLIIKSIFENFMVLLNC